LVAAIVLVVHALTGAPEPLDSLWRPVLAAPSRVLLCIGDMAGGQHPPEDPPITAMTILDFHFSIRKPNRP
jgi:hypothetical protein